MVDKKKPAPKKPAPKKPAPKKPAPRKPAPKKPAPKRRAPKKPALGKPAPEKSVASKGWSDATLSVAELFEIFTRLASDRPTSSATGPTVADLKAATYTVSSSEDNARLDLITVKFKFDLTPWLVGDELTFKTLTLESVRNGVLFFDTQAQGADQWPIDPRPKVW
jgi:outer membrane biosynthesis protein TonB